MAKYYAKKSEEKYYRGFIVHEIISKKGVKTDKESIKESEKRSRCEIFDEDDLAI